MPENSIAQTAAMSTGKSLSAALAFGLSSMLLTLFNKAVLSSYQFPGTHTLTFCQGIIAVIALLIMRWYRITTFPVWDLDVAWKAATLSMLYFGKIVTSAVSLGRVNVPMFTALRQLSIVFVIVEEYFLLDVRPSSIVMQSVMVIVGGAVLAASKDLTFDLRSYTYIIFANLFSSLYAVFINVTKAKTHLDVFGMLYYNYLVLLPLVFVLGIVTGDFEQSLAFPQLWDVGFQISFQSSVVLAFFLNVSAFYCTILNSARTKTVTGCLKNFFTMIFGLFLFSDYRYDHINFVGLMIGFCGSVWYSYLTYADSTPNNNKPLSIKSHTAMSTEMVGIGSPTPFAVNVAVEADIPASISPNSAAAVRTLKYRADKDSAVAPSPDDGPHSRTRVDGNDAHES